MVSKAGKMGNIITMFQKYYKNITKYLHFYYTCAIIRIYSKDEVIKMTVLMIIYVLILIIVALVLFAVMQIKLAGINVKDFWSFIEANQTLDKLYNFSKRYEKLSPQEQVVFLMEAEKVFNAFDKIPNILWEEEYSKYQKVLNTYQDIRVLRWATN